MMNFPQKSLIANALLLLCCFAGGLTVQARTEQTSTQQVDNTMRNVTDTKSTAGKTSATIFVGTYGDEHQPGGIYSLRLSQDGKNVEQLAHVEQPKLAGYLMYDAATTTLYSVDERKNDGRGPVEPSASVMAFSVNLESGHLTHVNTQIAPAPRPTYLSLDSQNRRLFSANHGDFEHVEKVVFKEGKWTSEYVYDDSTVIMYSLNKDGSIAGINDLVVLEGHGKDPNNSKQAGGHAQASPHAHSAVVSPDGKHLLVCDKGTDKVLVYAIADKLKLVNSYHFPEESAPRHLVFANDQRLYLDLEISSELASMEFNQETGELKLLDKISTLGPDFHGLNEPAEIRLHPNGRFVYVNNRGEDAIAWFSIGENGKLARLGSVKLAKSIHPGLASRSFAFDPDGRYLVSADRPDNKIKVYEVNTVNGALSQRSEFSVPQPAFLAFAIN
ncbi:lactonase family protein [Kosakonia sp. ML.JS2a]|uniref:lactonase family protein n=1 Tax=Kosakonia sp. ML.JS2a TaxID=2980557 RepID=UPI0021DAD897|nr:lactonase family protein [Kosakonia sp. ML.JS2a]UXY09840.1 lactonase family protein [Kosakonia sp. ML.JS2a]